MTEKENKTMKKLLTTITVLILMLNVSAQVTKKQKSNARLFYKVVSIEVSGILINTDTVYSDGGMIEIKAMQISEYYDIQLLQTTMRSLVNEYSDLQYVDTWEQATDNDNILYYRSIYSCGMEKENDLIDVAIMYYPETQLMFFFYEI